MVLRKVDLVRAGNRPKLPEASPTCLQMDFWLSSCLFVKISCTCIPRCPKSAEQKAWGKGRKGAFSGPPRSFLVLLLCRVSRYFFSLYRLAGLSPKVFHSNARDKLTIGVCNSNSEPELHRSVTQVPLLRKCYVVPDVTRATIVRRPIRKPKHDPVGKRERIPQPMRAHIKNRKLKFGRELRWISDRLQSIYCIHNNRITKGTTGSRAKIIYIRVAATFNFTSADS